PMGLLPLYSGRPWRPHYGVSGPPHHNVMVMPAYAGIQGVPGRWIPADAGMTFALCLHSPSMRIAKYLTCITRSMPSVTLVLEAIIPQMASKKMCGTTGNCQGNPFVTGLSYLYNLLLSALRPACEPVSTRDWLINLHTHHGRRLSMCGGTLHHEIGWHGK